MTPVNERTVLIFIVIIISVASLLCFIGLATPGWNGRNIFSLAISPAILCIISLLLLIISVIMAGIILSGIILNERLPLIFLILLIMSSIFILGAFTSVFISANNYSFIIMVASFTFTYLSSIIATYWLFGVRSNNKMIVTSGKHRQPKLEILT